MTTLIEFLEARLKEDYDHAYHAQGILGTPTPWWKWHDLKDRLPSLTRRDAMHIELHSPARALREVTAKRALLADFTDELRDAERHEDVDMIEAYTRLLGVIATVYSDHPDFDPAWRIT